MKKKTHQIAFPAILVGVMAAFLSTIVFFAVPNLSWAASGDKKPSTVARTSAVAQTEARIKEIQSALKVTKDQEELWNALTQVMRENAKEMDALTRERVGNAETMNAVERMKFHSRITEAHLDQQKKIIPPFEAFYASMSDEQRKGTDTIFRTGRSGKPKRK